MHATSHELTFSEAKEHCLEAVGWVSAELSLNHEFARVLRKTAESVSDAAIVGFGVLHLPEAVSTDPLDLSQYPFGNLNIKSLETKVVSDFINNFTTAWTTVRASFTGFRHRANNPAGS